LRVLKRDLRKGVIKLVPENLDDLWSLYNVIQEGDRVLAQTSREVKIRRDDSRPTKGKRRRMYLGVKVEKVAFHESVNRLRVMGVIFQGPESVPGIMGAHHTINIHPGKTFTLEKDEWSRYQLDRIQLACEEKAPPIMVVGIDNEECCVALLRHHGIEVKSEVKANLPGKLEAERRRTALTNYLKSVIDAMMNVWKDLKVSIAIVGPGYIKNDLGKYASSQNPQLAGKIEVVRTTSSGGLSGIKEALRSGVLEKIVKRLRAAEEARLIEQVLKRLGMQSRDVSYGVEEVERATDIGAVDHLFVADTSIRGIKDEERVRLEGIMRKVEDMKGTVMIVNTANEAGKKLLGLGGVAATLRYRIA
jgi:protein pelota